MASRLELEYRDRNLPEPWEMTEKFFNIIAPYLQPDGPDSAADTAAKLDALSPLKRQLLEGEEVESPYWFGYELSEQFIHIVHQVPYDHPSQGRLLELAKEFDRLGSEEPEVYNAPNRLALIPP